ADLPVFDNATAIPQWHQPGDIHLTDINNSASERRCWTSTRSYQEFQSRFEAAWSCWRRLFSIHLQQDIGIHGPGAFRGSHIGAAKTDSASRIKSSSMMRPMGSSGTFPSDASASCAFALFNHWRASSGRP